MNSPLPPDLTSFVEQQVASGQFQSVDEVVVQSLRLMQQRQRRIDDLQGMIAMADAEFERGECVEFDDQNLGALCEQIKLEARLILSQERKQDGSIQDQRPGEA